MINVTTKGHQAITFSSLYAPARGVLDVSRIVCVNWFCYTDIGWSESDQ